MNPTEATTGPWCPPADEVWISLIDEQPDGYGRRSFVAYWQGWLHAGRRPGVQAQVFRADLEEFIQGAAEADPITHKKELTARVFEAGEVPPAAAELPGEAR